jgi:hypothetical protein
VYLLDITSSLGGMSESTPAKPAAASASAASSAPVTKVIPRGTSTSLLFTIAVILSSLVFALPVTVGRLVEGILDTANPEGIKATGEGTAYLAQILGWSFGVLGALLLIVIVVYAMIYRRERTLDALKLPLMVIAIQIVLGVLALIFTQFTNPN